MRKYRLFTLVFCVFLSVSSYAQTGTKGNLFFSGGFYYGFITDNTLTLLDKTWVERLTFLKLSGNWEFPTRPGVFSLGLETGYSFGSRFGGDSSMDFIPMILTSSYTFPFAGGIFSVGPSIKLGGFGVIGQESFKMIPLAGARLETELRYVPFPISLYATGGVDIFPFAPEFGILPLVEVGLRFRRGTWNLTGQEGATTTSITSSIQSATMVQPLVDPEAVADQSQNVYELDAVVPLTPNILYRLSGNNGLPREIDLYQLVLSGTILMQSEYSGSNDRVLGGGRVLFEDIYYRDRITINDQTEGQASRIGFSGTNIVLSACFERDDEYQLHFSTVTGGPNEYFYLQYNPDNNIDPSSDEKGTIEYGGDTYRLGYTGDTRPYLMIKLTYEDTVMLNSRTATGRDVE